MTDHDDEVAKRDDALGGERDGAAEHARADASDARSQEADDRQDWELLERWQAGDRDAGLTLFRRYYPEIERFFMNKVAVGVGDLAQETFIGCIESRDKIRDAGKFRSYLFSIAYNVLRTRFRQQSRRPEHVGMEEVTAFDHAPGPSSITVQLEEQRLLLEALRHVPMADQVLLELFYWEELSIRDIAPIIDCPVNTVKGRLQRARKRLKDKLSELARSPALLHSTLTNLEGWARSIADRHRDAADPTDAADAVDAADSIDDGE
jgi:RNA polymerase sigma-70 factor (ECF subfamily)